MRPPLDVTRLQRYRQTSRLELHPHPAQTHGELHIYPPPFLVPLRGHTMSTHTTTLTCAILIPLLLVFLLLMGTIIFCLHRRRPPPPLPPDVEIVRLDTAIAEKAGVKPKDGILTQKETDRVERVVREEKEQALKEMECREGRTFVVACKERDEMWREMDRGRGE